MPDYSKLRDLVSHRVELEYDSGARVVGYVASCQPPSGMVQLMVLSKAQVLDATGAVLATHDALSVIPNVLVGVHVQEGPSGRRGR
jgi:hypothetical protein